MSEEVVSVIRGLIFDINGTVIDILTNEGEENIYRVLSNFLDYQGIALSPDELRRLYFEINKRQRRESAEEYPEFDVKALFAEIVDRHATAFTHALPKPKRKVLPEVLAELFRAASRFRLEPYPDVRRVLDELREDYRLAALSDGQSLWALPELRSAGLAGYFDPVLISSDLGYRKPDKRMFELMLVKMDLAPSEVLFVGNDMYRDVFGANRLDIRTVFFKSNQGDHRKSGAEPDYIIYNFSELPEAVRFLSNRA